MTAVASRVAPDHELIFVDDGSPDDSLRLRDALRERPAGVGRRALAQLRPSPRDDDRSRPRAWRAGVSHRFGSRGTTRVARAVRQSMRASDSDVIYGVQEKRKGSWFERATGHLFMPLSTCCRIRRFPKPVTVRLMTRRYVQRWSAPRARTMIAGLWALTGFSKVRSPRSRSTAEALHIKHRPKVSSARQFGHLVQRPPARADLLLGLAIVLASQRWPPSIWSTRLFFGVLCPAGRRSSSRSGCSAASCSSASASSGCTCRRIFNQNQAAAYTIVSQVHERAEDTRPARRRYSRRSAAITPRAGTIRPHAAGRGLELRAIAGAAVRQLLRAARIRRVTPRSSTTAAATARWSTTSSGRPAFAAYRGFDITAAMIAARPRAPCRRRRGARSPRTADAAARRLRGGERHLQRQARSRTTRGAPTCATRSTTLDASGRGFAFNMLSTYSDPERRATISTTRIRCAVFDLCTAALLAARRAAARLSALRVHDLS